MAQPNPSRRALLGGGAFAGAIVAVPAIAAVPAGSPIEQHWQERRTAYREFNDDPDVLYDAARASSYWDRIDPAEEAIMHCAATDARTNELRLWVAWSHCERTNDQAVQQGDVAMLRRIRPSLDWHEKLLLAAILALRGEG